MQSEQPSPTSRNLRITTEPHSDLRATQHVKPDTRRFATIFTREVPDVVPVDCCDATHKEHNDDSDDVPTLDNDTSTTQAQVASAASADESLALSEAQQIIVCYRAVHGDYAPESPPTEINDDPSQIPDDQRSMYTIATSVNTQSTMDLMWRPKPKIHMRRADQNALIQAQTQAIAMMHNAGLKPTSKIQCRRRGCADILSGVEALKYHLHIHNIADVAAKRNDAPPPTACEASLVRRSASDSKGSKKTHFRSKSSLGTQQKPSMTHLSPRKLSACSLLLPSPIPLRESTPDARQDVPSLTTVAKSFISDHSRSKSANLLSDRNNDESCTHISTACRGRRARKGSMAVSVGADAHSIAMLLSPRASPDVHDRENAREVSEKLTGSRSPIRALSPIRAMSPIRNGIRRVLSIGCPVDSNV